ncbi:MAG: TatD family hydrolase [Dehalococcoidia bacterium]|nr:TatD family hydrolase [Dehalococcoidia bacterium]
MYSDSHTHMDGYTDDQMATVLADAKAKGVDIVLGVGTTLDQSQATIEIARRFPVIIAAVGVHPWWASPADLEKQTLFRSLASQRGVVAIGEVGIDLEKNPSTAGVQWRVFELQLGLARELNKPLLLHCKGAHKEMQDMLRREPSIRGVFHGFSGNAADAGSWLALGLYVGIGVRTLTRNYTPEVELAIRSIPLDRMLLETDASVRSFTSEEALRPTKVIEVAEAVGRIHGVTPDEVGRRTTANLRALLGL